MRMYATERTGAYVCEVCERRVKRTYHFPVRFTRQRDGKVHLRNRRICIRCVEREMKQTRDEADMRHCVHCGEFVEICALERGEPLPPNANPLLVREWYTQQPTVILDAFEDEWTPADQARWERAEHITAFSAEDRWDDDEDAIAKAQEDAAWDAWMNEEFGGDE